MQLLAQPHDVTSGGMFEVMVESEPAKGEKGVKVTWQQVKMNVSEEPLGTVSPLTFG